jgi:hypothetical protein
MIETVVDSLEEPNAILTGGPAGFAANGGRTWFADRPDRVVKLLNGNRYEHFAPTSETVTVDGRALQVFRWAGYTKIAE